jgi:hypothetical protein
VALQLHACTTFKQVVANFTSTHCIDVLFVLILLQHKKQLKDQKEVNHVQAVALDEFQLEVDELKLDASKMHDALVVSEMKVCTRMLQYSS